MSWASWLQERAGELQAGLNDFTAQLQDDSHEVRQNLSGNFAAAGDNLSSAGRSIASVGERVGEGLVAATAAGEETVGEPLSGPLDELSERLERVTAGVTAASSKLLDRSLGGLQQLADTAATLATGAPAGASDARAGPVTPPDHPPATPSRWVATQLRHAATPAALLRPPADGAAFGAWRGEFDREAHVARIAHLLEHDDALHDAYVELVPDRMADADFWAR